jgi:uncharacterized SAM-binding protein YcdF (DUF218 family)
MDAFVWTVANLITALIIPPGVFFALLAVGLAWTRKYPWARSLTIASLVGFVLLSLNVVGYALLRPLEQAWPPLDPGVAKALRSEQAFIVVLGGGRTLGALEYPQRETLAGPSLRRTVYAAQLSTRTGLPLAVSGGGPGGGVSGEAVLMKDLLENGFGRPVAVVEKQSFDTRQNATYMAGALAARKVHTVVLVTDVFHMPRAVREFESAGLKVVPAPVSFRASAPLNVTDFLPSVDGLELSRQAIREYVATVWYGLRRALDSWQSGGHAQ